MLPVLLNTAKVVSLVLNHPLLIHGEAPLSDHGIGGVVVGSVGVLAGNSDGGIPRRIHELDQVMNAAVSCEIRITAITLSS